MKYPDDFINQVIEGDCLEVMKDIPDNSIDCVLTDPPYGMGIDEWDKDFDKDWFFSICKRILNPNGFIAFFCQMPYTVGFCNVANRYFDYMECIAWIKRACVPSYRVMRGYEQILVYGLENKEFYKTRGKYTDVKLSGLLVDTVSWEAIKRRMSDMQYNIKYGKRRYKKTSKRQDVFSRLDGEVWAFNEDANFTNVWSFSPAKRANLNNDYFHPTEKPVKVLHRLLEMLSLPNHLILDPFLGSGTTAVACKELGRNFIGIEINPEYCEIAKKRLAQEVLPFEKPKPQSVETEKQLNLTGESKWEV